MAKKKRQSITVEDALNEVNEIYGAYEDNIPTKRSEEQNDASQLGYDGSNGSKNTIFNHKNLLSDGYQFGDISKTVGASALDIGSNLLHGLWNISEGISDSINYLKADYNEARGNKEKANLIRTQTAKDNIWGEDSFLNGTDNKIKEITDKDSILGDKIDTLNQGIGYSVGLGAIGAMPAGSVLSNATTLISSIGNSESQAYNEQYQNALNNSFNGSMEEYLNSDEGKQTAQNARLYGLLAGATETATENMAGGLGNLFNKATGKATKTLGVTAGFGDLDDKIAKGLANKFESQVAKNLVEFGVKAGGEGSEEVVGGFADALWQKITYKKGEKYWDLVKDQNIPESALSATISSAIMQSPQFVQTTKTGRDFITNMTPQEESSYNVILSNKQKQLMKDKTINNEIDTKYKDLTDEEKTQKYQELSTSYDNYDIKPTKLTRDEIEQTENEAYQEMYNNLYPQQNAEQNIQTDEQNTKKSPMNIKENIAMTSDELNKINEKTQKNFEKNDNVVFESVNKIASYQDTGGYRTEAQVNNLIEDIKENGIVNPIEIKKKNGKYEITDGNHRLAIAKAMGIKNIPVIYTNQNENIDFSNQSSYNDDERIQYIRGDKDGNSSEIKGTKGNDDTMQSINGYDAINRNEIENGRTDGGHDRVFEEIQKNNDRPSSNTTREQNIVLQGLQNLQSKQKGLENSSPFNLHESNKRRQLEINNNQNSQQDPTQNQFNSQEQQIISTKNKNAPDSNIVENSTKIKGYHGTDENFDNFDLKYFGKHDQGDFGKAVYFSDNENTASKYGKNVKQQDIELNNPYIINTEEDYKQLWSQLAKETDISKLDKTELKLLKDPYTSQEEKNFMLYDKLNSEEKANAIQKLGYDGVIDNTYGQIAVFSTDKINNNQQRQEILNKAKQVEQINPDFKGLSDDIKNNYLNNKDIKLDDINEYLNNILKENEKKTQKEANSILNESTYKEDAQRKKDYMKFKNDNTAYKTEEVNNALMSVKANRNGKRTVNQWKEVANQIGQQLAINDRNENYVQRIAFKSWFDLQPNTKESITRYDNQTKQNQAFQKFTSDDWVNTIYKSYKEQIQNMNVNEKNSVESQTTIKQSAQNDNNPNINTPGEMVDYSQMERPTEGKQRKFYKSIIESSNTTAEAKKISKELIGYDTYVPTSNVKNLKEADNNINTNGTENSLTALTTKVNNNEKLTATDVATGERLIEYYSKVGDKEHLQEAIQTTALAGTQAGQAVQAFALLNRMTPQGQVTYIQRSINKINKKLEDKYNKSLFKGNRELQQFNFTPEMQQEILNANGKGELESAIDDVYRQLGQQVSKSSIEKIDAWRYFSMLGNPRTHIRNIVGNKAMEELQGIKNKVAGAIEDAVLGNQDVERTNTLKRASKQTIAFAKNDINNVKLELGLEENKYNSQSMLSKYQNTFENKTLQNTLGKLMNLNDKLLEAEDGWGLKSNYVKSLSNYLTANNLDVNNISDKQLQKARNHAIKEAQESTFHQDCYIASAINTIENKNLATKVAFGSVLPFKKTPINITKTALEYNPVGLAKTITYDSVQLRKGNINVNQYIDNLSKGLTGTGVALLGFALAQAGIIKASGGDDDKKEEFEEGQGKQSYSITIGNHTYSLDWLAPTGIPLFVGAEFYSLANKKAGGTEEKGSSANKLFKSATNILNAGATSANPLSEMSMISGLTSALQSYANGTKSIENMALNAGKSYISQFVPTSLGQVAKTLDTKERSTTSTASDPLAKNIDSLANQVKSKIPGLRETLPTKTDTWGNEVNQEGNVARRFLNNAIVPWNKKQVTTNETDSKLSELYEETGDSAVLPKNNINNTLTIDKQKYRLSNDEYSRLKKMYGETNYNILNDLMKSESFQSLDNEQKTKAVEKVYSYSQALIKSQYADMNDIDTEDAKIVQKVQNIARWGGKASDYFNFSGGSTDEETSDEKATRLKSMDISNKSKEAIYHYDFGQKDKTFSSINKIGVDIDDYLDFKSQKFKNSEDYSSKEQYMDYLDEATMPLKSKELLFATKYTLNETQKDELFDYIDNSSLNRAEKLELFKNLKGFKVLENGNISY